MRVLYLHGYASGPQSIKGVAFEQHFAPRGIAIERLDLRVPSPEHLRLSAMIDVVRARLADDTIVIGSSLGGLTAARVAEREARVKALVLMAPAFQLAARWRGQPDVDPEFLADVAAIDVGWPDVRVPALILHGVRDDVVPIEHSRSFAAGRANVELVELDDGHDLVASLPRLLAETERFLRTASA